MAWIQTIDDSEAEGDLKEIYKKITGERGKLSNIMRVHSLNPKAMNAHLDLYLTIMFSRAGPTREQRELIATAASSTNKCDYCNHHHAAALDFYWKDKEKTNAFMQNPGGFELPDADRALVDYAIKLTSHPETMVESDVERLRDAGFSDDDILAVNLIVSYFNFVNRIALGLGVEFTPEEVAGYNY